MRRTILHLLLTAALLAGVGCADVTRAVGAIGQEIARPLTPAECGGLEPAVAEVLHDLIFIVAAPQLLIMMMTTPGG